MARSPVAEPAAPAGPMVPIPYRVARRRRETHDSWTLELEPHGGAAVEPLAPGQFAMLYAFGKGEVPISVSALPLVHTIRAVGTVSAALCDTRRGDVVGVRGPFGTTWPIEAAEGADVVVLAGGIGLAPLRPVVRHLLASRERYGRVVVLYGGRSPEELLYTAELERWRGRFAAAAAGLGPVCRNPFRSIVVRSVEILYALDEALRIIAAYDEPAAPAIDVPPRAGSGCGWTEAPRGMLWHRYRLDADGTILEARIVPPTSQNQASIEADLRGFFARNLDLDDDRLRHLCEQAIRNYDPCISCATHFLALEVDRA